MVCNSPKASQFYYRAYPVRNKIFSVITALTFFNIKRRLVITAAFYSSPCFKRAGKEEDNYKSSDEPASKVELEMPLSLETTSPSPPKP